jgi:uncharacterized membrane protein
VVALFFTLIGLGIAVLPIVSLLKQMGLASRIDALERSLETQRRTIDDLRRRLTQAEKAAGVDTAAPAPQPPVEPLRPAAVQPPRVEPVRPPTVQPPAPGRPIPATPGELPPLIAPPRTEKPAAADAPRTTPLAQPLPSSRPASAGSGPVPPPPAPGAARVPPQLPAPPAPPSSPWASFDWEQLVGVKLFSAIAGIALVLAAIFFFRYTLDRGWLAPPVRVAIGIVVGTALIVVCELRAARRYRITANALDAAAIAILFSTFFAAHALWDLIPSSATFALLIVVTVLAVLLSIRHDSIFIAILGLIGGFATPALLSTGENQPIPLFTYLLLLNIGLAWVAIRMKWPVLTLLTLVLTTAYQWGWVVRFLSTSDLRLAMGIFLVFAVTSFVALALGRRGAADGTMELTLERSGLAASAMPLFFAVFLSAVPQYGANTGLLFGFLLVVALGLTAIAIAQRDERLHAMGGLATVLVFAIWPATSFTLSASRMVVGFAVAFALVYVLAPVAAERLRRPFTGIGNRTAYVAPVLLFIFAVVVRLDPRTAEPYATFGALFFVLAVIAWRAFAMHEAGLYFVGAVFALAAEATWSATHFVPERLWVAVGLYAGFGLFYLGVPFAWRRAGRQMVPRWGGGAVLIASLPLLLFLADSQHAAAAIWGLALLLAILDAGLFIESAAGRMPLLSLVGGTTSWVVLAYWWNNAAAAVGVLPALLVIAGLSLVMLGGHTWAHRQAKAAGIGDDTTRSGFRQGLYLGLVGQLFLFYLAQDPRWALPPWPLLGALAVLTLATTAASLGVQRSHLHAAGVTAAALVILSMSLTLTEEWALTLIAAAEVAAAYAVGALRVSLAGRGAPLVRTIGALAALFITELSLISAAHTAARGIFPAVIVAHVANLSAVLLLAWQHRLPQVAMAAVVPAWVATLMWPIDHQAAGDWLGALIFVSAVYAVFAAYPLVLGRRAAGERGPYITAIVGSVAFFFAARNALLIGDLRAYVGAVPVVAGIMLALTLRQLLVLEPPGQRDLGRLALVAAASLGFATVAIPLQLSNQWITIGWALEGAALAWLYTRVPHRGLLYATAALMAAVFVRLVLNPAVFVYEPRGSVRLLNWYLYAYTTSAAAMYLAARWLKATDDRVFTDAPRTSTLLIPAAVIVLFLLLNIEVADYFATGPAITFRFGADVAQDLTYTLAWLAFGMIMLAAGIYSRNRYGRIAALALITITTSKAFLYDLGSLGGLYRVGSLVGLAASLALVALALQKFVLLTPKENP